MEYRQFGKTDMKVSVLGFGGAEIGFEGATPEVVKDLLNGAIDAGLNVIDTAECYLQSEELIGQAIAHRRKDFHLFTKAGHPDGMSGPANWKPESILKTLERSLQRLQTDSVDLLQLHSCSEADLRKGDVIAALREARDKGQTRYIGYSGDGAAAKYAVDCGAFDTLQTSLSIADQEPIDLTLPVARSKNIGVIAKRPIANAVWRYPKRPDNAYHEGYWDRLQKLAYEFTQGDAKEAGSIALRFTLFQPGVHTAIVGTTKPGRWKANAELAAQGPLPAELQKAIHERWKQVGAGWGGLT